MIITVCNEKGGVGKTTTATALASMLQAKGYKTLLIDTDQQGNATDTYKAKIEGVATLYDVIVEKPGIPIREAIQETENGAIVAADPLLREADFKRMQESSWDFKLADALQDLTEYDYIIIDTPPNRGSMLFAALTASDKVIIPVTADRYSLQGLEQLNETIRGIKRQNSRLKTGGLLLIKYNARTNLSKETLEALEIIADKTGIHLYKTYIRESTKAREAQAKRLPLLQYAPKCTTSVDYMAFIDEMLQDAE